MQTPGSVIKETKQNSCCTQEANLIIIISVQYKTMFQTSHGNKKTFHLILQMEGMNRTGSNNKIKDHGRIEGTQHNVCLKTLSVFLSRNKEGSDVFFPLNVLSLFMFSFIVFMKRSLLQVHRAQHAIQPLKINREFFVEWSERKLETKN